MECEGKSVLKKLNLHKILYSTSCKFCCHCAKFILFLNKGLEPVFCLFLDTLHYITVNNHCFGNKLYEQVETQTTNQRQCNHNRWPEVNVGQLYQQGLDHLVHQM